MKKFGMARNKNLEKSLIELTESMQSGVEKRLETLEAVRSLANELTSSETQGQIKGARESLNGRKNI